MQAIRTAGQKQLSGDLSGMATTGVRYIYALPFACLYLIFISEQRDVALPALNNEFLQYALIACFMQIIGTFCLVAAFKYRNFSVATSLAKTEAIQVAVVGALVFSVSLSLLGWLSVLIGVIGVLIVSKVRFTFESKIHALLVIWASQPSPGCLGLGLSGALLKEHCVLDTSFQGGFSAG
mgnify:CR=1 FL=1